MSAPRYVLPPSSPRCSPPRRSRNRRFLPDSNRWHRSRRPRRDARTVDRPVLPAPARRHRAAAGRRCGRGARLLRGRARSEGRAPRAPRDRDRASDAPARRRRAAAKLWLDLAPDAERPRQILAGLASGTVGRERRRRGPEDDLKAGSRSCSPTRHSPAAASARRSCSSTARSRGSRTRPPVYEMIRDLAEPYATSAGGAVRRRARRVQHRAARRERLPKPLATRSTGRWRSSPTGSAPRCSRARSSPVVDDAAIEFLAGIRPPESRCQARWGALAQFYVEQKRYADARRVFEKLWTRIRRRANTRSAPPSCPTR